MYNKGKWYAVGLMLTLAVGLTACSGVSQTSAQKEQQPRIESAGYDTPEAAVQAYLGFMKEMDLSGMVSAYAIESYVENYDFEAQLKRIRAYMMSQSVLPPNVNEFTTDINIERRRHTIVQAVSNQTLVLSELELDLTRTVTFENDSQIEEFVDDYSDALADIDFSTLELLGFINPVELHELYASAANWKTMSAMGDIIGADEMVSVAAVFTIDNQNYLLCCDAVQYGEQWFMVNPGGNIGNLIGLSAYSSGVVPLSRSEYREMKSFIEAVEE